MITNRRKSSIFMDQAETKLIQMSLFASRRKSSIHLEKAEKDLLSYKLAKSGAWLPDWCHPVSLEDTSLANEYYHKVSEAPFKKRFGDFDINFDSKIMTENKNGKQDLYSGNQTVYYIDDDVMECSRPSMYQLMKMYKQKPKLAMEIAGKSGIKLPPISQSQSTTRGGTLNISDNEKNGTANKSQLTTDAKTENVQRTKIQADLTRNLSIVEGTRSSALGLVITAAPGDAIAQLNRQQNSTYVKRKTYGENMERNWLLEQMKKNNYNGVRDELLNLNTDLFYNFTESEGESDVGLDSVRDTQSAQDRKCHPLEKDVELFSSTDVLFGKEGELDESTASEYEIAIKDNVLVERKSKHKMRKKRRLKKVKIYRKCAQDRNVKAPDISHFTDTQLRAMRLKIPRKSVPVRLKGKRKFLQVANAVFIFVQFTKILQEVRMSKRKKRIALKKSKNVSWLRSLEGTYHEFERNTTPFSLKETFLKTVGHDLVRDVMKLKIRDNTSQGQGQDTHGSESEEMSDRPSIDQRPFTPIEELLSCVSEDAPLHRLANRRHSDPGLARPALFAIEMHEKHRRKRSRAMSKCSMKKPGSINKRNRKRTCSRDGYKKSSKCVTRGESITKNEPILFEKSEVLNKRRPSLDEEKLKDGKRIELRELLDGVDIPAKEIKIQVAMRRMYRRKSRQYRCADAAAMQTSVIRRPRFGFDDVVLPTKRQNPTVLDTASRCDTLQTEELITEEMHRCSRVTEDVLNHRTPKKSIPCYSGFPWNPVTTPPRLSYSDQDIAREMERVSKLMLEMKNCHYIRWTPFQQAVIDRMDMNSDHNQAIC